MYISKTTLTLIIGALLAVILFTWHHSPASLQEGSEQVDTLEWVNDAGDIVASLKADPSYFAADRAHLIDSLAKVYNSKPKNVIEYVIATTEGQSDIRPEGKPTVEDYFPIDTAKKDCPPVQRNVAQNFSSPYYKAHVQIGDSSYMHLQSFDTVTVLWKKVNEGSIFNRKHLIQLDVSTANPDTKVSGIKAYRIYEKPKRWAIGVQLGYGVSFTDKIPNPVPMISFGITRTIIRF
jgi:hypothetical protein